MVSVTVQKDIAFYRITVFVKGSTSLIGIAS